MSISGQSISDKGPRKDGHWGPVVGESFALPPMLATILGPVPMIVGVSCSPFPSSTIYWPISQQLCSSTRSSRPSVTIYRGLNSSFRLSWTPSFLWLMDHNIPEENTFGESVAQTDQQICVIYTIRKQKVSETKLWLMLNTFSSIAGPRDYQWTFQDAVITISLRSRCWRKGKFKKICAGMNVLMRFRVLRVAQQTLSAWASDSLVIFTLQQLNLLRFFCLICENATSSPQCLLRALQTTSGIFYHGVCKNLELSGESVWNTRRRERVLVSTQFWH